jgi:hypothetical protein
MCLLLALANIGYYLRAKTEERHLLKSCPEYAVYCQALASKTDLARAATISKAI